MNKELREDLEHIIICSDKTITQDLRDDISLTLQYIDELENKIDKTTEHIKNCIIINNEAVNELSNISETEKGMLRSENAVFYSLLLDLGDD